MQRFDTCCRLCIHVRAFCYIPIVCISSAVSQKQRHCFYVIAVLCEIFSTPVITQLRTEIFHISMIGTRSFKLSQPVSALADRKDRYLRINRQRFSSCRKCQTCQCVKCVRRVNLCLLADAGPARTCLWRAGAGGRRTSQTSRDPASATRRCRRDELQLYATGVRETSFIRMSWVVQICFSWSLVWELDVRWACPNDGYIQRMSDGCNGLTQDVYECRVDV